MSNKEKIIKNLEILIRYQTLTKDKNWGFRVRAYRGVISAIKNLPVEDITNIRQVQGVKGIGKRNIEKIAQFLKFGIIPEAEEKKELLKDLENNPKNKIIKLFSSVKGIGEKVAERLWELGMRTIDDLRKHKDDMYLFKGSKKERRLLTDVQQIGLKYYEDLKERVPRKNIKIIYLLIKVLVYQNFGKENIEMKAVGSYRRGLSSSGDIDIIFTSKTVTLDQIVQLLKKWDIITATLSHKKGVKAGVHSVYHGITHCPNNSGKHYQLDITSIPGENWGAALLHYTGSARFNIKLRQKALKLNYKLNEKGLISKESGKKLPLYSEEAIFKALDEPWVKPTDRNI